MSLISRVTFINLVNLGFLQFCLVNFFLITFDRENYATTLLQFSSQQGIRSQFMLLDFADLGLAFGTNFPLLGFFDITPLPILSALLGVKLGWSIYVIGLVILSNYIIIKNLSFITSSKINIFLTTSLLTTFSPIWMDSNLYNDWPATWSAAVFTVMVWVIFFRGLYLKQFSKEDPLLIAYFSANIYSNDPGYFPIFAIGLLAMFSGFGSLYSKKVLLSFKSISKINLFYLILLGFYFLIITVELYLLGTKFSSLQRNFSDTPGYRQVIDFFASPQTGYRQRELGAYTPTIFVPLFLLLFRKRLSRMAKRFAFIGFSMIIVSLVPIGSLIDYLRINPNLFFFYPTGGFFLRDIGVLLVILTLFKNSTELNGKFFSSSSLSISALVGLFIFQASLGQFFAVDVKEKFEMYVSRINAHPNNFILPKDLDNVSRGLAFTEKALSELNSGVSEEYWMASDFQQLGQRLVTASTKLQSKDFFLPERNIFQATTIRGNLDFWCDKATVENYWIDYVIASKVEDLNNNCAGRPFLDFPKLRIYFVNPTQGLLHYVKAFKSESNSLNLDLRVSVIPRFKGSQLLLDFSSNLESELFLIEQIEIPIEFSENLKIYMNGNELQAYSSMKGFTKINTRGIDGVLSVEYVPTSTQKIRIFYTYIFISILILMVAHRTFLTSKRRT